MGKWNKKQAFQRAGLTYKKENLPKKLGEYVMEHVFHSNHIRPMLRNIIKNNQRKELIGCELGVHDGKHAFAMLYHLPMKKMYLVDPYEVYNDYEQSLTAYKGEFNDAESDAHERMKRFGDKAVFIKKRSEFAIDEISEKLDFVYIDANPRYDYIMKNLELYYPKVKKGGVFGGHDFCAGVFNASVARAVIDFANKKDLKLQGSSTDWWIIKE